MIRRIWSESLGFLHPDSGDCGHSLLGVLSCYNSIWLPPIELIRKSVVHYRWVLGRNSVILSFLFLFLPPSAYTATQTCKSWLHVVLRCRCTVACISQTPKRQRRSVMNKNRSVLFTKERRKRVKCWNRDILPFCEKYELILKVMAATCLSKVWKTWSGTEKKHPEEHLATN